VAGANRYRNPDEDLPADFEAQRIPYYQALNLPLDRFVADLQAEMRDALQTLDAGLSNNPHVRIGRKYGSSWITLTPFDAQPEPQWVGPLLWPAAAVHAVLTILLILSLFRAAKAG
jgi:hypothetical protein